MMNQSAAPAKLKIFLERHKLCHSFSPWIYFFPKRAEQKSSQMHPEPSPLYLNKLVTNL